MISEIYLCFMDFGISKIYQDSTIQLYRFYLKRSETPHVLDQSETQIRNLQNMFTLWEFQKVEICKNSFLKDLLISLDFRK